MRPSDIPIRRPCDQRWSRLQPRGIDRYCADCRRMVHDLSARTEAQARALVRARDRGGERVCLSYRVDERGRIAFAPGRLVSATRLTAGAAALTTVLAGCAPHLAPGHTPTIEIEDEPLPTRVETDLVPVVPTEPAPREAEPAPEAEPVAQLEPAPLEAEPVPSPDTPEDAEPSRRRAAKSDDKVELRLLGF